MNENNLSSNQSDFILYTSNDGKVKVDVVLKDETVWLTQKAMAGLFGGVKVPAISKHLANIYETGGELEKESTISILEMVQQEEYRGKNSLQNFSGNQFFNTTPAANHAELKAHE